MDVEVGFVVGEEMVGWASTVCVGNGMVSQCGWGCRYILKLEIKDVYGRWGCVVEVFDFLVVKVGGDM